jgi:general secretion pathway protein J
MSSKFFCFGAARERSRRQGGLTLIELLVAISVLAFVAVLGWRGLDSIVRARIALNNDLEQTRGLQLAFAQMQNDFAQVVTGSAVPDRAPLVIGPDRVTLIRKVYAESQPSRLQVITYQVKNGVLTRRESASTRDLVELDKLWAAAESGVEAGQDVALQSGVAAMTMRLWGPNGWGEANANPEQPEAQETTERVSKGAMAASAGRPAPAIVSPARSQSALTGLQVALQLQDRESNLLKVFLLGAV